MTTNDFASTPDHANFIAATRRWLEVAVIGLNLCPFAKAVHHHQQIRYQVSDAFDVAALRDDLERELLFLSESDPAITDTTLLIAPRILHDFMDYNDFLRVADRLVRKLDLEGTLQVASFHPLYQFAGSDADDIENCTNRSPYPMLHLLREASIERAVAVFPDAQTIVERNLATLRQLGYAGWQALGMNHRHGPD